MFDSITICSTWSAAREAPLIFVDDLGVTCYCFAGVDMRRSFPRTIAAYIAFFCMTACGQTETVSDWPQWRGPDGNGISPERAWDSTSLDDELNILWKASVGIGYSSVAVAGNRVYTMGNQGNVDTVICLNAISGETIWTYSYPCPIGSYPGPRATPLVDDGLVYTASREGHLFAFNAADGAIVWSRHLRNDFDARAPSWGFAGSPVIDGNLLILNAGRSGIALDKKTGNKVWDSGRGPGAYATPVLFDNNGTTAAAIFGQRALYAVNISNGNVLWSFPWVTGSNVNAADPVVGDGKAFVSSAYNHGSAAIDISNGDPELLWQNHAFESHFNSFVLIDGFIYGCDGDVRSPASGTFRCVDFDTGEIMWSAKIGYGAIIAAGDRLVILTYNGGITVARATERRYEEIAKGRLPRSQYWTPPALSNSRLYCRTVRGDLYCIELN